jgi:pyridoxine 5-phosphate synthase
MMRLHVNVDHVATIRNARGTLYPDPVFAAQLCEQAGADGITMHLREDRRHILDEDVRRARAALSTVLNLEMGATDEMIAFAKEIRPNVITLVPERREERTTEGGLDVSSAEQQILRARTVCEESNTKLSLFIEPDRTQIDMSRRLGANQVELHTGAYANAAGKERGSLLAALRVAAAHARDLGLEVAAGHGLTRHNTADIAAIDEIVELNIGHAVISDALFVGFPDAVQAFRESVNRGLELRQSRVLRTES